MTAKNYINNRNRLLEKLPKADSILIVGNANVIRNADTTYPFRQDSNVLYLSGLDVPSISIYIDCNKNKTYIVLPIQTSTELIFEGKIDIQQLINNSGCDDAITYRELFTKLNRQKQIYANLPVANKVGSSFRNGFRKYVNTQLVSKKIHTKDIRPTLSSLRSVKQEYEIKAIKKAVTVTKQALDNIKPIMWQKDQTEQSLAWAITAEFAKYNMGHAYPPIVATDSNAATLHISPSSKTIGNALLFDVGAEYCDYSADISRCYFKNSSEIYLDLCQVQNEIIKNIKPGIFFKDIQDMSVKLLANLSKKYKLNEPIATLFPHAIGHHLGLDTHDIADYKVPLLENMVITIEPGLYSKEKGYGMRVEDDILITSMGATVL